MKIICTRTKLLEAFQTAAAVAPTRSPKEILTNVKLEVSQEGAIVMGTDLEVGVRTRVDEVEIEAPGAAVLPIQRFGAILRELPDEKIRIEADPQGTRVKGERSDFKLPGENPDEFPAPTTFDEPVYHELPARFLKEVIRRTIFATDNESSRYALGGVLFEFEEHKLTAVGTDGRRLAKMEGPATCVGEFKPSDQMTIIPVKALQLIERAITDADAEVQIAARSNDVLIKSSRVTIYARLVEGRFPKWRDVFPQRDTEITIELPVGQFYSGVRQAAIVTSEESRGIDFQFRDGTAVLAAVGAETGESHVEMPIAYDGDEVAIMLDPKFMSDFLRVLDPDKTFTLHLENSDRAAVCTTDDGYGYVIMPMARDR